MADGSSKSPVGAVATILIAIVVIWLGLKLLGVALKLIGVLIIVGLAAAAYFALKGRLGGPDQRA
jgi:ABC-type transport system involved in cytochrome bd biosynthesis fused ATPase/permease subunit